MKSSQRAIKFFLREDIWKLVESIPDDARGRRDKALVEMLFSTGLRVSEALELKIDQFREGTAMQEVTIIGKGGWQRSVFISKRAMKALRHYVGNRMENSMTVFPVTARCIQIMLQRRSYAAGLPKLTPH